MARGRKASGEVVDGMLLLDKPAGCSSNQALQTCKRLLNARKAGHTGSLDPLATGLLPLCFGQATKVSGWFLDSDKSYDVTLRLGVATDSGDAEGRVIHSSDRPVAESELHDCLSCFRGDIEQVPPMYSAVKQGGRPLYKLARKGVEVERKPRPVTVYELSVKEFDGDSVSLSMRCSKGFYVRSLAIDLGEMLGCGAHVTVLRRTRVGVFDLSGAVSLEQLEALGDPVARRARLIPADEALGELPRVDLTAAAAAGVRQGQVVQVPGLETPGMVRLYEGTGRFLGLGEVSAGGRVAPRRLFV